MEEDTRKRVRTLLYQVFEPLPPGAENTFLESLADAFFIPNTDQLHELTDELTAIAKYRFGLFVEKFIFAIGNYILDLLEDLIRDAINFILEWEENLQRLYSV